MYKESSAFNFQFSATQIIVGGLVIAWLIGGVLILTSTSQTCKTHHDTYDLTTYTLHATRYTLLVADTPERQKYGLMRIQSKKDICGADGMIFRFSRSEPRAFWNQNTLFDLDLYWIRDEAVISQVVLPAIGQTKTPITVSSGQPVDTVVEIIKEISPTPSRQWQGSPECVITGCSGQICALASDEKKTGGMVSTCEWREEYACYKSGRCEYDAVMKKCGWAKTPELTKCLTSSPVP